MLKARPGKEVVVRVENAVGTLDEIAKIVSDRGANLLATCAWVEGDRAVVHLVTDDHRRVLEALAARYVDVREADVVISEAPHKPGMLRRATDRLAAGDIDIHHFYATASMAQDQCLFVFATANNDRAVVLLNGRAEHAAPYSRADV